MKKIDIKHITYSFYIEGFHGFPGYISGTKFDMTSNTMLIMGKYCYNFSVGQIP